MVDDRRRPLRDDELARIARAIDPDARAIESAPLLGGLDAATYALDLDIGGERRELVVRVFTLPLHRDGAAARRYWKAITGIPVNAPVLVPRPVHLDAEGVLIGLPCMVMTRLPGAPFARPANEDIWIGELAGAVAAIHSVDVNGLPSDYPRAPAPVEAVEQRLTHWSPTILEDLWRDVATALRSAAPRVRSNGMVLTHGDFWFGNTLWSGERLTGVVDWDDAQINDPGFDIGYARADLQLVLGGNAADRFLAGYETRLGRVRSIAFWDLVSTLPAFRWLDDWAVGYREVGRSEITGDLARERFASFVRKALRAL